MIAASKHSITEVAKVYNVSRNTLGSWIKHIKSTGIENLKAPATRRRKQKLDEDKLKEIKGIIEANPNITIATLKVKIEEEYGIVLGKSTVHRIMHKLNYSYITPRPKHYKQNPNLVEEFKKNLPLKLQSNANLKKAIFFFDETRFGTHSKIGHCWLKKGVRSSVKVKLGFQNFYLSSRGVREQAIKCHFYFRQEIS